MNALRTCGEEDHVRQVAADRATALVDWIARSCGPALSTHADGGFTTQHHVAVERVADLYVEAFYAGRRTG